MLHTNLSAKFTELMPNGRYNRQGLSEPCCAIVARLGICLGIVIMAWRIRATKHASKTDQGVGADFCDRPAAVVACANSAGPKRHATASASRAEHDLLARAGRA